MLLEETDDGLVVPISVRGLDATLCEAASRVLRLKEIPSLKLKRTPSKEANWPENVETVKPSCCCVVVVVVLVLCCCVVVVSLLLLCFCFV